MSRGTRYLVTGASGFLGFAVAKGLQDQGRSVGALVRRSSRVSGLRREGIPLVYGDILDRQSLIDSFANFNTVIHCAARVGDWGRFKDFYATNVIGTRNVLEACTLSGVKRLFYFSSVDIFGSPTGYLINEASPFRSRPGGYGKSKQMAERLVRHYLGRGKVAVTIVYPSWVYGEGDRQFMPEIVQALRAGQVFFFGRHGQNRIELVYIRNLVSACLHLLDREDTAGQGYILSDEDKVTLQDFVNAIAGKIGAPRVTRSIPYALSYTVATAWEALYRLLGIRKRPLLTRHAVSLMGKEIRYDTAKMKSTGWRQPFRFPQALALTLKALPEASAAAPRDAATSTGSSGG